MAILGHTDDISWKRVTGWISVKESPAVATSVKVMVNGREHGRCMADRPRPGLSRHLGPDATDSHGFVYEFAPELSQVRPVTIDVLHAETNRPVPDGHRTLYPASGITYTRHPIIITSRGRAGTTVLMKWLRDHPDVLVADAYPFEIELASYYVAASTVLCSPKFTGTENDPDFVRHALETFQIGRNPWSNPKLLSSLGGGELESLFSESLRDRLASTFRTLILDAYRTVAKKTSKSDARFFAEKCSLEPEIRYGIRDMFDGVREIVMVRDPRDFLCSAKSFWHFDTDRALRELRRTLPQYMDIKELNRPDTLIVKYEDLVSDREQTLSRVADHIGITVPVVPEASSELFKVHATSKTPESSIGRWRSDLSQAELEACAELSAPFMEAFGYQF